MSRPYRRSPPGRSRPVECRSTRSSSCEGLAVDQRDGCAKVVGTAQRDELPEPGPVETCIRMQDVLAVAGMDDVLLPVAGEPEPPPGPGNDLPDRIRGLGVVGVSAEHAAQRRVRQPGR